MSTFELRVYRGIQPGGERARLIWDPLERIVRLEEAEGAWEANFPVGKVDLLAAQGGERRLFRFPNGWTAESSEVEAVDAWGRSIGRGHFFRFINLLESRYRWTLATLVVIGFAVAWMYIYGLPMAARKIAFDLPVSTAEVLSTSTWDILERMYLSETRLDEEVRAELKAGFTQLVDGLEQGFDYRLHFRSSPMFGANAFALPSGQIVVTDDLVDMANTPEEILAILAHEIGHVEERHGLRMVLQTSAMFVALTVVTGDVSGVTSMGALLPSVILQGSYSRSYEREADEYALKRMLEVGLDPMHFVNIMNRLDSRKEDGVTKAFNYLETHPLGAERVRAFEEASQREEAGDE